MMMASMLLALSACNDDDSSGARNEFAAIFLHHVVDAGELYLDGDERPYGRVSFGRFGNGVLLAEDTWDLDVKDENDEDSTDTEIILDTSFDISDTDRAQIFALSGRLADDSIRLHKLLSAFDEESSLYTSSDDADDSLIYINFANIHPAFDGVKVYLLQDDETIDSVEPDAILDYGNYSTDLILDKAKQRLVVVDTNDQIVFESGEKTLNDELRQIIILAENPSAPEGFNAYYFFGSNFNSEMWTSDTGEGSVRVFNAVYEENMQSITDLQDDEDILAGVELPFATASTFTQQPVGQHDFSVSFSGSSQTVVPSTFVNNQTEETIIVTGRLGDEEKLDIVTLENDKRSVATKARVTLVHLGYKTDFDQLRTFNIHLTPVDSTEELENRTPEVTAITYRGVGEIEKSVVANDTEGETYTLRVMDEFNRITFSRMDLLLKSASFYQVALIEEGDETYRLVLINGTED